MAGAWKRPRELNAMVKRNERKEKRREEHKEGRKGGRKESGCGMNYVSGSTRC